MKKLSSKFLPLVVITLVLIVTLASLSACNFAPVKSVAKTDVATAYVPPTRVPTATSTPLPTATPLPAEEDCSNYLSYVDDVTIPDGYEADPGEVIDKQWKIRNGGTCNWGPGYTLQVIENEDDVEVTESIALYPLLKDGDAVIQVVFTAPEEEGSYEIKWKAVDPDGNSYNEFLSVFFNVKPPTE